MSITDTGFQDGRLQTPSIAGIGIRPPDARFNAQMESALNNTEALTIFEKEDLFTALFSLLKSPTLIPKKIEDFLTKTAGENSVFLMQNDEILKPAIEVMKEGAPAHQQIVWKMYQESSGSLTTPQKILEESHLIDSLKANKGKHWLAWPQGTRNTLVLYLAIASALDPENQNILLYLGAPALTGIIATTRWLKASQRCELLKRTDDNFDYALGRSRSSIELFFHTPPLPAGSKSFRRLLQDPELSSENKEAVVALQRQLRA